MMYRKGESTAEAGYIMKKSVILATALLLSGCVTAEERAAQMTALDDGKCQGYGAKPGTSIYVQCRAQLDSARTQADATIAAALPPTIYTPPLYTPPMPRLCQYDGQKLNC